MFKDVTKSANLLYVEVAKRTTTSPFGKFSSLKAEGSDMPVSDISSVQFMLWVNPSYAVLLLVPCSTSPV